MNRSDVRRGTLLSTGAAAGGAAFLLPYREASHMADAQVVALALLCSAAIFNTSAVAIVRRGRVTFDRVSVIVAVVLAALTVMGNICSATALLTLDPATASVLMRTQVVFVAIGGALLLHEHLTWAVAIGVLLTVAGMAVMQVSSGGTTTLGGSLWALGAAACFASMSVLTRKVIHSIEPVAVNASRLWIAVVVLAVMPGTARAAIDGGPELWAMTALAAFFGPFVSRLCLMFSLRHVTAAYSTLVELSSPVFAFVFALILLRVVPSTVELIGGGIILAGIAVPVLTALRSRTPLPPPE